ncbi:KPN_02809 family neutral zinc metallopeptidase [Jannaschia rubra]|uniref:Putative metalloprotease n=1 Tax=Jannaschia rubra TaxID=282197 RepID=A0A0M6XVG7_9RHOB|nr:neutral zinc metallopeptidase [Jannaschia rubra]CTQ34135.1 putative metalloprotease [Jannaschia rubra]SFG22400.1 hypothetical protein SAMN04488517_103209 [Jannaschia rubra]
MRWQGRRGSRNIEDRRGRRGGAGMAGGIGGMGIIAVLLIGWFFGVDVSPFLTGGGGGYTSGPSRPVTEAEQREAQFVSVVLADTEEVWADLFREQVDAEYRPPVLVLYSGVTGSPCGGASGATGPFYCPADGKIYLDTAFFTTMEQQLGAQGDFAAAYVVAHEVAHHVQDELGILGQANRIRAQATPEQSNAVSVRVELQADCLAGIWARAAQDRFGTLDPGDVDEAIDAARRIGDDTLQRSAGRVPMPHTFTHGTSRQRARWFATGFEEGRIAACDTFSAPSL